MVFIAGNALQCHSHWILAGLRAKIEGKREDGLQTTEDGYALPRGGAFSVVSCPHYLGEIVIYGGLVLMLGGSNIGIWIVLAWVVRPPLASTVQLHYVMVPLGGFGALPVSAEGAHALSICPRF